MIESLFNPEFMTRELAFGMNLAEFLTILAMLVMTYSTRLLGWLPQEPQVLRQNSGAP